MKTLSQNHGNRIMRTKMRGNSGGTDGARLCAQHQPQRVTRPRVTETFHDCRTESPLRLVCDTAALRGQCPNAPGRRLALQSGFMILCIMILWSFPAFAAEQTATYRLIGLSAPEREEDLRVVMKSVADVTFVSLDAAKAEVTLRFDVEKLFPPTKSKQSPAPDKITERLNSLLGSASKNTFHLAAPSTVPADKLTKVEIPIGVLDCKGCRYAAYSAIAKLDGVERATVSATPSAVIAWIDATKTKRETLEEALKKARVDVLAKP